MYMEAYGSVGNWADSIIKKSISAGFTRKMAKEDLKDATSKDVEWNENAISDDGVSPSGGVGSTANPETKIKMDAISRQKAMESLKSKIENLEGLRIYQEGLISQRDKDIQGLQEKNKDLEDKLGRRLLRK